MKTFIWQYQVVNTGMFKNLGANALQKTLNDLGAQGWELTGTVNSPKTSHLGEVTQYIFKRPTMYTTVPPAPWIQQPRSGC